MIYWQQILGLFIFKANQFIDNFRISLRKYYAQIPCYAHYILLFTDIQYLYFPDSWFFQTPVNLTVWPAATNHVITMCCSGMRCHMKTCSCVCMRCRNCDDCSHPFGIGMGSVVAGTIAGKSVCLFASVFYVPSKARSFRDGTPINCPLDVELGKYIVLAGNRTPGRRVAFHHATAVRSLFTKFTALF